MFELWATVQNAHGIHCRPSAVIVKEAQKYRGDIEVSCEAGESDARSAVSLLTLGLQAGSRVRVRVSGPEEETFCRKLAALFERHFDFPPVEFVDPLVDIPQFTDRT